MTPSGFLDLESRMPGSPYGVYRYVLKHYGPRAANCTLEKLFIAGHCKRRIIRSGALIYELIAWSTLPRICDAVVEILAETYGEQHSITLAAARQRARKFMRQRALSNGEMPVPANILISILVSTFDREGHEQAVQELRIATDPYYAHKKARDE
jgi:hypothetical protein